MCQLGAGALGVWGKESVVHLQGRAECSHHCFITGYMYTLILPHTANSAFTSEPVCLPPAFLYVQEPIPGEKRQLRWCRSQGHQARPCSSAGEQPNTRPQRLRSHQSPTPPLPPSGLPAGLKHPWQPPEPQKQEDNPEPFSWALDPALPAPQVQAGGGIGAVQVLAACPLHSLSHSLCSPLQGRLPNLHVSFK